MELSKTMTFGDLMNECPEASQVLVSRGLHCVGCHIAFSESIEDGARVHGLSDQEIEAMMDEIRALK